MVLEVAAQKVVCVLKREERGVREEKDPGLERLGGKRSTAEEAMDSVCCVLCVCGGFALITCGCACGWAEGLRT